MREIGVTGLQKAVDSSLDRNAKEYRRRRSKKRYESLNCRRLWTALWTGKLKEIEGEGVRRHRCYKTAEDSGGSSPGRNAKIIALSVDLSSRLAGVAWKVRGVKKEKENKSI